MTDFFNRVMFRSTTDGLVDFGVGAAMTGYSTPAQRGVPDETIVSYTAESDDSIEWETGLGSYDVDTLTVRRTTIRESSNANSIVNFAVEPRVWFDFHAQDVPSGSGDVVGPASATDNAVVRFDGTTGKLIQDSNMTLADNGDLLQAVTRPAEALTWDGGNVDALGQFNVLLRSGEVANNQIAFSMLMNADNNDTVVDIDKDFKVNILAGAFRLTTDQGLEITLTGGDVTMQVDDGSFNVNCSGKVTVDCAQDCQWASATSMQFVVSDGAEDTVARIFMTHNGQTPIVGYGSGIAFRFEGSVPDAPHMGAIDCTLTDATVDENHTDLRFYTMVEGVENVEQMRLSQSTTATHTSLLLWDTDNGTLERVTVGAADSGGTGFKVLRIPN